MSSWFRRGALCVAVAAAAACGSEPDSGNLHLVLTGPAAARAIELRLVGKVIAPVSAAGVRFFTDTLGVDTVVIVAVAQQGQALPVESVGHIQVPDVRATYDVLLLQVTAPDYSRRDPASYTVTVTPTP